MSEKWGPDDLSEEERSNPEFQPGRHEAVLRLLLERGADVGAMTDAGQTVLHIAAASGDVTTIEIILERMPHVDVSVQNEHGRTSLGSAFMGKHETALRVLLTSAKLETADFGSDEQRRDALSWTSVNPVRHDIAKLIMAKMPKNTEEPILVESDVWSAIEFCGCSLPVLPGLRRQERYSSEQ
ncbi:Ankyrin repeat domain-containing protein 16 [Fusarium piperis]|uniref:protein S-acyltransferase n=1 Tax=Fusarium piperis TaxID=1435070 RepID=A0A9W8W377_9HYPO|nr:Ankyrin repeat domain-containing protein 16 [Fusarium piperis]